MKGVIAVCLAQLVKEKFGVEKWEQSLQSAGLDKNTTFLPRQDVPDQTVLKLVQGICDTLNISLAQAADAFGDYWVNCYAPNIYMVYYDGTSSAKDFLLKMDSVHQSVTRHLDNAHPPRFDYEWKNDKTLLMHYKSRRGLIDFVVGLAKGVGRYYNESIDVKKIDDTKIQITFK